jgi:hypothetical protein
MWKKLSVVWFVQVFESGVYVEAYSIFENRPPLQEPWLVFPWRYWRECENEARPY